MNAFTTTLTSGSLTISGADGVMALSVQADATAGSFTISGNIPFQGITPTPITLVNGGTVTLNAYSPASPLAGIVITWVSGTVDILIGF